MGHPSLKKRVVPSASTSSIRLFPSNLQVIEYSSNLCTALSLYREKKKECRTNLSALHRGKIVTWPSVSRGFIQPSPDTVTTLSHMDCAFSTIPRRVSFALLAQTRDESLLSSPRGHSRYLPRLPGLATGIVRDRCLLYLLLRL